MLGPRPVRPSHRPEHNAGSLVRIPYASRDDELGSLALTGLRWRLDDLTNTREVTDWTTVSEPPASGTITIPAASNTMYDDFSPDRQLMQVTIEYTSAEGVRQELKHYVLCRVWQG